MFELKYFIIGLVQGITEFLPISSSGHLVLISEVSNWKDQGLFTDIAVHGGTLIAVLIYLRKEIFKIIKNLYQCRLFQNTLFFKMILATLPAVIVGFFIYEFVGLWFFYFGKRRGLGRKYAGRENCTGTQYNIKTYIFREKRGLSAASKIPLGFIF